MATLPSTAVAASTAFDAQALEMRLQRVFKDQNQHVGIELGGGTRAADGDDDAVAGLSLLAASESYGAAAEDIGYFPLSEQASGSHIRQLPNSLGLRLGGLGVCPAGVPGGQLTSPPAVQAGAGGASVYAGEPMLDPPSQGRQPPPYGAGVVMAPDNAAKYPSSPADAPADPAAALTRPQLMARPDCGPSSLDDGMARQSTPLKLAYINTPFQLGGLGTGLDSPGYHPAANIPGYFSGVVLQHQKPPPVPVASPTVPGVPMMSPVSAGSVGHPFSCAAPCKYSHRRGCKDGAACTRCHICRWSREAEKRAKATRGGPDSPVRCKPVPSAEVGA
uniref:C3H1-type domain-containing protein n=1 Tax=Zooxanthella nutricula TaxID=1333877 RepID=A0A6U9JAL8_9DINO|mmetsp:Transcript_44988/g.136412  ORF Transcript_44988/g.136412 Transcript_44988/m.136412 type:complete len:333 (+) Transcript_44988:139-1137(+)